MTSPRLALARDLTRCSVLEVDDARVRLTKLSERVFLMSDSEFEEVFLDIVAEREAVFRDRGGPRERFYRGQP